MLKFIYLKNQKVPVPVPVTNLREALDWVAQTFGNKGQIITRVMLNGDEVNLDFNADFDKICLDATSDLTFQLDDAKDLSVQTLEAVKDFALVVLPRVKQIAVELYRGANEECINDFDEVMTDLEFIFDLKFHINGILDQYHEALAPFEGLAYLAELVKKDLVRLQRKKLWSDAAITILGRLEPFLKELIKEIDTLQIKVGEDETVVLPEAI
jgi:hypothetical protein